MRYRFLLLGWIALGMTTSSAVAQPFLEPAAAIGQAGALAARIRSYHQGPGAWTGLTPPPASYCATMLEGEAAVKELARLASRAILYRQPGLAVRLQTAGNGLSDALDAEEEINHQADIPFTVYPCPAPPGSYPARAFVLRLVVQRLPFCRTKADALRASFAARRALMQQCLRVRVS
jgi:hypothetical protein